MHHSRRHPRKESARHTRPARLGHLLFNPDLAETIKGRTDDLRSVVRTAADLGIPIPGFVATLAYYDGLRSARLPANLIQAQRDYFGSHTYRRVDIPGVFHTNWDKTNRSFHGSRPNIKADGPDHLRRVGDLTWRKLVPALYNLWLDGYLPERFALLGLGRSPMTSDAFRRRLREGIDKFSRRGK